MKRTDRRAIILAAWACALITGQLAVAGQDWSFNVSPYLWVANVEIETSLPSVSPSAPPSADRFDTKIGAGAMFAAQARYRSVGLFVDFAWLQLNTEAINAGPLYSAVNLKSDFIHSTAALTYRLPLEGKFQVEALAGARVWHVANNLESTKGLLPGFDASPDKTWVDPMVGASLNYDLTKRWSVGLKGMVGGFGVSADIAGEVFAGVTYRYKEWGSATLGYRYLHEEYDRAFKFNLDTQGFLLGFGFHF